LLRVPDIGPWTVQCLGLHGRGDPDSLPAGDLAFLKLVGRLAGLGRRATIPEVEEFYAPYEPFRGLAGHLTRVGLHHAVAQGPPLRLAA
jgi:3-methyladenine DNA glycosylase/8-oxoguanine DNA glycosylase